MTDKEKRAAGWKRRDEEPILFWIEGEDDIGTRSLTTLDCGPGAVM
jgi:hypothetical protein